MALTFRRAFTLEARAVRHLTRRRHRRVALRLGAAADPDSDPHPLSSVALRSSASRSASHNHPTRRSSAAIFYDTWYRPDRSPASLSAISTRRMHTINAAFGGPTARSAAAPPPERPSRPTVLANVATVRSDASRCSHAQAARESSLKVGGYRRDLVRHGRAYLNDRFDDITRKPDAKFRVAAPTMADSVSVWLRSRSLLAGGRKIADAVSAHGRVSEAGASMASANPRCAHQEMDGRVLRACVQRARQDRDGCTRRITSTTSSKASRVPARVLIPARAANCRASPKPVSAPATASARSARPGVSPAEACITIPPRGLSAYRVEVGRFSRVTAWTDTTTLQRWEEPDAAAVSSTREMLASRDV